MYVSRLARETGLQPGMSLAEAEALEASHKSHNQARLHWEEHDALADRERLQQLATASQQFSPLVGLEATDHPSCLLLDVTNSAVRLGGERRLTEQVADFVHQHDYHSRLAIADTIGAAWAIAQFGSGSCGSGDCGSGDCGSGDCGSGDCPATNHQSLITNHTQLAKLPIESLRLESSTVALLHQLGIQCIEDLLALPRRGLLSRFGAELLTRLDQAFGKIAESVEAFSPAPPLEQSWALEHPTSRRDTIEQVVMHLLSELAQQLHSQQRGVIQLQCRLYCDVSQRDASQRLEFQTGFYQPTSSVEDLAELLRIQLERRTLPGPVHQIVLTATTTSRRSDQQNSLLDDQQARSPHALSHLINRLSSRLGRNEVTGVQLLPEAQAERAFHYIPLTGDQCRVALGSSTAARRHHHCAGWRPLGLKTTPIPLQATSVTPDGPPISFRHGNRTYQIAHYWGPERVETGWWRDGLVQRDYYRVQDQFGCRFWMFRNLEDGRWFLHGEFV